MPNQYPSVNEIAAIIDPDTVNKKGSLEYIVALLKAIKVIECLTDYDMADAKKAWRQNYQKLMEVLEEQARKEAAGKSRLNIYR